MGARALERATAKKFWFGISLHDALPISQIPARVANQSHFPLILQCHVAASESGTQRRHQWSNGAGSMAGAVAIDPLARRRDRLTASGRRCSTIAKKKRLKRSSYGRAGAGAGNGQKVLVRNQPARRSSDLANPGACG